MKEEKTFDNLIDGLLHLGFLSCVAERFEEINMVYFNGYLRAYTPSLKNQFTGKEFKALIRGRMIKSIKERSSFVINPKLAVEILKIHQEERLKITFL